MEWKEVRLGDIATMQYGKLAPKKKDAGNVPIFTGYKNVGYTDKINCNKNTIVVVARGVGGCGDVKITNEDCYLTNLAISVSLNAQFCVPMFFYYLHQLENLSILNSGSAQPQITIESLTKYSFRIPSLDDQRRIVTVLSSLDRKIELNNKINADLEEMAQAIFKNWFVDFEPFKDGKFVDSELGMIPEGWKVGRLTEIASYMNGLAMQKFPPENNEDSLPVLKIKELGQGFCGTDSDRCSCNIKDECKIHNGDVIFSWSGTLLVDVWCGGDCGLNQHLFKVTSKDYPKWFYYYWTKHHLQEFIHIAKDKAVTMGHIKRGHLEEAMVAIPDNDSMEKAHELFEPILSKMISLRLESSRLSLLRDTLLPRLMSGELEVPE